MLVIFILPYVLIFLGLVFSFFIPQITFDSISNEVNQCSTFGFMDLCQSSAAR